VLVYKVSLYHRAGMSMGTEVVLEDELSGTGANAGGCPSYTTTA